MMVVGTRSFGCCSSIATLPWSKHIRRVKQFLSLVCFSLLAAADGVVITYGCSVKLAHGAQHPFFVAPPVLHPTQLVSSERTKLHLVRW